MVQILQDVNLQKEKLFHKGIICTVDIHRKAMHIVSIL